MGVGALSEARICIEMRSDLIDTISHPSALPLTKRRIDVTHQAEQFAVTLMRPSSDISGKMARCT